MAGFESIGVSQGDLNWSALLHRVLEQLDSETVLLFLDDFFLTSRANTRAASALLNEMNRLGAAHLRLVPHPEYLLRTELSSLVGSHDPRLPYRASLQAGFWRRDVLMSLLRDGESPWDFEVLASRRSLELDAPFFAALRNPVPYIDVLERGKWLPRGIHLCRRERIGVDLSVRPRINAPDIARRFCGGLVSFFINKIPTEIRASIRGRIARQK